MTYVPADDRYAQIPYRRSGRSGLKLPALSLGRNVHARSMEGADERPGDGPVPPGHPGQPLEVVRIRGHSENVDALPHGEDVPTTQLERSKTARRLHVDGVDEAHGPATIR